MMKSTCLDGPSVPVLIWHSPTAGPDETVILTGDIDGCIAEMSPLSCDAVTSPPPAGLQETSDLPWTPVQVTASSSTTLQVVVPADWKPGVFACRACRGDASTVPVLINCPQVWWMQGDRAEQYHPGGWLRLFGRSLSMDKKTVVVLRSLKDSVTLTARDASAYALTVDLPNELAQGCYEVWVHNGFGGDKGWALAGEVMVSAEAVAAPLIFNVQDFGAEPDKAKDCTPAIVAALEHLAGVGGGVLYFPRGRYRVDGGLRSGMWIAHSLRIPPGVTLRGESMESVSLYWPERENPLPTLIEAEERFGVEEMTLYTQGRHRNVISGGGHSRIHRVRIRANGYLGLITKGQPFRGHKVDESHWEMGTAIELCGSDVQVTDCDIYHSAAALTLKHVRGGLISGNRLRYGYNYLQAYGGESIIFENNYMSGASLTATGGVISLFFGAMSARHYYFANNILEDMFGADREAMTLDGHGTAYLGKIAQSNENKVELAGDIHLGGTQQFALPHAHGATLFVLAGRGTGQLRTITAVAGRQLTLESPLQVSLDHSSVVTVGKRNGRHLFIGNRFSDTGYPVQLYPPNDECVIAENEIRRCAGINVISCLGYGRDTRQLQAEASWRNEVRDNHVIEGNGWGGPTGFRFQDQTCGATAVNIWAQQFSYYTDELGHDRTRPLQPEELAHASGGEWSPDDLAMCCWHVVRNHIGEDNHSICVGGVVAQMTVEHCRLSRTPVGIRVDRDSLNDMDAKEVAALGVDCHRGKPQGIVVRGLVCQDVEVAIAGEVADAVINGDAGGAPAGVGGVDPPLLLPPARRKRADRGAVNALTTLEAGIAAPFALPAAEHSVLDG